MKTLIVILMSMLITSCAVLNPYPNADTPVNRAGKEDWPIVRVEQQEGGRVLITTVRTDASVFRKMASVINSKFRQEVLLDADNLNAISVRYHRGSMGVDYVINDIDVERNKSYTLSYERDGRKIKVTLTDDEANESIPYRVGR